MAKKFKTYNQQQNWLFPPSIEEMIPDDHPVRIVNGVIEKINLQNLLESYSNDGASSYHPKMLLKVMIYAYMDNTYSSRKIEKAMRENINYMWLSNRTVADHNTLARFRSKKLKTAFKSVFKQVVLLLAEEGLLTLKEVFTDGTKIESAAGRYTFVWGNAIKTRKEKMVTQLEQMWEYAQSIADDEDKDPEPPKFKKLEKETIEKAAEKINAILKGKKESDPKMKAKARYIKKNFVENISKYEEQEKILNGRNSYSKTDPDATFMRMKDDHMQNGQLKPGYNVQISSENQFVVNYTIHQQPTDYQTLAAHLENHEALYESKPEELTADAGYGSQENYEMLQQKGIKSYVKYNTFDKEIGAAKSKQKTKPDFSKNALYYNEQEDFYTCPIGQKMEKVGEANKKTTTGYLQKTSKYRAKNCDGCSMRGSCFKGKGNRVVERNHQLEEFKKMARTNLLSDEGIKKRIQRTADVEPVFAHIKSNRNFKRFTLKGIEKAELEFGLHALAHNLKKKRA